MTRALTHFFGSTDGYRTLARAPGVSDADDAALAALGFGSPRTQADFDALLSQPCMAGRALPSGRFAITRVFTGTPDVAGRQTVERRTLILDPQDWSRLLASDLAATLVMERNWSRARFVAGEPIDVETVASEDLLPEPGDDERRAFDALLEAQRTGRCATFPDDPRWRRATLRLGSLLPEDRHIGLGWGVGLWAVPAGVWLATLRADAQPRHAAPARLAGPWLHPEIVGTLGHPHAEPRKPGRAARAGRRRGAPPPWSIGVAAATVMLLLTLWFAFGGRATGSSRAPYAVGTETPEARPAVGAPTPPAETASASDAPAPARASAEPGPITPPAIPAPGESFRAATADRSFGSGEEAAGRTAPATTPEVASPPAATPTPPPAPAADAPAIPPPPVLESTPWDAEVEALARAIDLADRVRAIAKRGEPDADATLREAEALTAEAGRLRVAAIAVEASLARPTGRGTERRIFYADEIQAGTTKALRGVSSSVLEKLSLGAFPPETARQVALLAARFEIAQAAQALVASPLGQSDRVRKVLRDEIRADGWPSPEPFDQWLFRHRRNGSMSASEAERFMADQFATRLTNLKGMKGLVRELRRICPASGVSPSAPSPAPAASP